MWVFINSRLQQRAESENFGKAPRQAPLRQAGVVQTTRTQRSYLGLLQLSSRRSRKSKHSGTAADVEVGNHKAEAIANAAEDIV